MNLKLPRNKYIFFGSGITKYQSNFLKLIGIVFMAFDHFSVFIFSVPIFRIFGRLVFPIFAFQLVLGFQKTSDRKKYFLNLLSLALISQIPYFLLPTFYPLNIIFSLLTGFLAIYSIEKKSFLSLIPLAFISLFCSYGFYGYLTMLVIYFLINNLKMLIFSFSILTFLYCIFYNSYIQLFSIFAFFLIYNTKIPEITIPKWLFYLFYPLHLLVIYAILLLF